jgi:hypothetical protein
MKGVRCALIETATVKTEAIAQSAIPPSTNAPGLRPSLSASPPYSCSINYCVDGANANDSNPGTQAKPWKTIQNAS